MENHPCSENAKKYPKNIKRYGSFNENEYLCPPLVKFDILSRKTVGETLFVYLKESAEEPDVCIEEENPYPDDGVCISTEALSGTITACVVVVVCVVILLIYCFCCRECCSKCCCNCYFCCDCCLCCCCCHKDDPDKDISEIN